MYKVNFYTPIDRKSPVKEFLDSSSPKLRAKIVRQLKYVKEFGLSPAIPNLKKITGTFLWELRILGKDNIRIVCIPFSEKVIKVIHIFRKKTQKTSGKELNIAIKRSKEALDR